MSSKYAARNNKDSIETRNKDLNVIKNILEVMKVEYDPAIVPQLLSCAYEYTSSVLDRAQKLAVHAGRLPSQVRPSDVSLAIRSGRTGITYRNTRSGIFTAKKLMADERNKKPIPRISSTFGVYIPKSAAPASVSLFDNYIVTIDDPTTNDSKNNKNNSNNTKPNTTTTNTAPPIALPTTTTGTTATTPATTDTNASITESSVTNPKKRKAPDDDDGEIEAAFEKRPRIN
eukprot:g4681.t1